MKVSRFVSTHSLVVCVLVLGIASIHADSGQRKVRLCHQPTGQAGLQTITVGEDAVPDHLGHGDTPGRCRIGRGRGTRGVGCNPSCDDGNACTVDTCRRICADLRCMIYRAICLADHPPVDCDDGNPCTTDSCDPDLGCLNAPIDCSDGVNCTVDTCVGGECFNPDIDCGEAEVCDEASGACVDPCDGVICAPADDCQEPGTCIVVDGLPECLDGGPVEDGTACSDGDNDTIDDVCVDGSCAGRPAACPCWNGELRVTAGLGSLGGQSLISDPDPICFIDPRPVGDWDVVCAATATEASHEETEVCGELQIYESTIVRGYVVSDSSVDGLRCEARIVDGGYYSMFNLRSSVGGLTTQEYADCEALLLQVFDCP